jgi:Family of unknown function (DUF5719)
MRRVSIAAVLVVAALLALGVAGAVTGTTASRALLPAVTTAPVTAAELVCPRIDSGSATTGGMTVVADVARALSPPSQSSGQVSATKLTDRHGRRTSTLTLSPAAVTATRKGLIPALAVKAVGSIAASVVADQTALTSSGRFRSLVGSRCVPPATDWWFAGADGRVGYTDILQLGNPAPTAAEVSLSMWSHNGPVPGSHLDTVRVPARSSVTMPLASIAPDVPTIALHVHASSGAVSAALVDRRASGLRANGGDFMPATVPPTRHAVVAGFAAGAGSSRLVLANPGGVAAMVGLRLVTSSGAFVPAGDNQVVVPPGHTRVVVLDKAFAGATGAVELASDQPVVAEGLSIVTAAPQRPDLMWLAATPPLVGSAGVARGRAPDGGHTLLLLSAPAGGASVRLSTPSGGDRTLSVPAGRSVEVDVTAAVKPRVASQLTGPWPFAVTVLGAVPVFGVRVLSFAGAHGALVTGEPLVALPTPTVLPVVREDPRVATR